MEINSSQQQQTQATLHLSPGAIKVFKRAYLLEYHQVISDEDADRIGTNLLRLIKLSIQKKQEIIERMKYA